MAVTARMKSLMQVGVFCTQPFRLPYAGRVGICIFDKTGTLTSDALQLQHVIAAADVPNNKKWDVSENVDTESATVLAGCHSLIVVDGRTEGHPEEKAAAEHLGLQLRDSRTSEPTRQINIDRHKMYAKVVNAVQYCNNICSCTRSILRWRACRLLPLSVRTDAFQINLLPFMCFN
jgi:magnesium-transporting ATPase (P-type)